MDTVGELSSEFKQALASVYEPNETEALALLTLSEITGLTKAQLKAFPEKQLMPEQAEHIKNIQTRLQTGEPIQYILGYTEFFGLQFNVNSSVLIPRPETEELVEWVWDEVSSLKLAVGSILDIGTGSGCIAISLKKKLPGATVSAVDISGAAIDTAKQNADLNKVEIDFIQDDILNPSNLSLLTNHYSLMVSNPPYVTQQDKNQMHRNVIDFEPHTALFVPENDPLMFYKAIADFAMANLNLEGLLFFEINESLGKETMEMLAAKGFKNIELRKDMGGRDRMIRAGK